MKVVLFLVAFAFAYSGHAADLDSAMTAKVSHIDSLLAEVKMNLIDLEKSLHQEELSSLITSYDSLGVKMELIIDQYSSCFSSSIDEPTNIACQKLAELASCLNSALIKVETEIKYRYYKLEDQKKLDH